MTIRTSSSPRNVWLDALTAARRLTIDSSPELIRDVRRRRHKSGFTGLAAVPDLVREFAPVQDVEIRPIALLHSIGVITTPIVPNLADLSSTWSLYRYIWAFDPRPSKGHLYLSDPAKNIDFHQKTLFSDHMGVGITEWIMTCYFSAGIGIDVDVALRDPTVKRRLGLRKTGIKSPDYLFQLPGDKWAIVESKGTFGSRSSSLGQLQSGLVQLPGVQLDPRIQARMFVIGIGLSQTQQKTRVYMVEVAGHYDAKVSEATSMKEKPPRFADETASDQQFLAARSELYRRYSEVVAAKLLSYAGAEGTASRILEGGVRNDLRTTPPSELFISETANMFLGQYVQLPVRGAADLTIDVFQGLEAETYEYLSQELFREREHGERRVSEAWQRGRRQTNVPQDYRGEVVFQSEDERTISSLASDGSLLQISFRER